MKSNNQEEVVVFKPLSSANGPRNTLSFTHLAYLLTFHKCMGVGWGLRESDC